ncbi:hypothetical protein M1116_02040 [Patescibacteria group bacterium]|nr:hypothetical protein [Patescibacteria group bacterium]
MVIDKIPDTVSTVENQLPLTPQESGKQNILNRLPANLPEQLGNYVRKVQQEEDEYSQRKGLPQHQIDKRRTVKGRFFEMLARAEMQEEDSAQAAELLQLLHNPEDYDRNRELVIGRNPDLAFVEVDEEGITIKGVGEVKSGKHLDRRCFSQLAGTGIRKTLERTVAWLNRHRGKLEELGLEALAKTEGEFKVAKDFKQTLVVPSDVDSNPLSLIDYRDFPDRKMFGDFLKLLQDGQRVEIKKSSFSSNEINKMVEVLLPEIKSD